jgi:hypothetical protein
MFDDCIAYSRHGGPVRELSRMQGFEISFVSTNAKSRSVHAFTMASLRHSAGFFAMRKTVTKSRKWPQTRLTAMSHIDGGEFK